MICLLERLFVAGLGREPILQGLGLLPQHGEVGDQETLRVSAAGTVMPLFLPTESSSARFRAVLTLQVCLPSPSFTASRWPAPPSTYRWPPLG